MSFLNHKERSLLPVFVLGSCCVQIIALLILILSFGKIGKIADAKTPVLVELNDGTSARVAPLPYNERTEQAISTFTGETLMSLLSWHSGNYSLDAKVDTSKDVQLDQGVEVEKGKVTTPVWQSSFALAEDFRSSFLSELGSLTPPTVFTGQTQTLLLVRHLSPPQQVGSGKWSQDMVGSLVFLENGKYMGKNLPFNKTIFIRAIDTPSLSRNATDLQKAAYKARTSGLEIYKIQDLVQK